MQQAFVGVDVGTSSARAGIFDENGTLLATARHPITVWHEAGSVAEQSSAEIWAACAASVRAVMAEAALPASAIKGVGFDATCSLVVVDASGHPLTVSSSGDVRRNVIVWMDHRAMAEARPGQPDAGRCAPLCRRLDLAGNGNSQTAVAEAAPAVDLSISRSFLRPCRLSFVSRHRIDRAFDVHIGLQMELSRPRTALEPELFPARWSWRSRLGRICEDRQQYRCARHAARRRCDGSRRARSWPVRRNSRWRLVD